MAWYLVNPRGNFHFPFPFPFPYMNLNKTIYPPQYTPVSCYITCHLPSHLCSSPNRTAEDLFCGHTPNFPQVNKFYSHCLKVPVYIDVWNLGTNSIDRSDQIYLQFSKQSDFNSAFCFSCVCEAWIEIV